ncbi:Tyrosine-protein phosphatase YwqE [Spirosomataceae bacterium TFI 002]|nr:Tyrosine-protein phosphatase YwqE [Spirosomataceae bacterium TFI 002]
MRTIIEKSTLNLKSTTKNVSVLTVDMHNHILPSLDDGSENMEIALHLAAGMVKKGFKKVFATPHIMPGFYNNDEEKILRKVNMLRQNLKDENIHLEIDYAAEYYVDENFIKLMDTGIKPITIGRHTNFVLIETSFVESFQNVLKAVEKLLNMGYKPVLAHPERYIYLDETNRRCEKLQNLGVLFQLNINSLGGYYSQQTKKKAEYMVEHDLVSFLGTNIHNDIQLQSLDYATSSPYYHLALKSSRLLNYALV